MSNPESKAKLPDIRLHSSTSAVRKPGEYTNLRSENRDKVQWSAEECAALQSGVERCGEGAWTEIMHEYRDVFHPDRRVIDLVNKYKQHIKRSSFYVTQKKHWVEVGEDGEPRPNCMGEVVTYSEKFPYEAAAKVAKRLEFNGYQTTQVTIREAEDISNVHFYKISVNADKIKIKKVVPKPVK